MRSTVWGVEKVRSLVPTLPRDAWIVLGGDLLSALGTGLTLPFFVVYLHRVRGIDLAVAGAALSAVALAGFVGNPLSGWLVDRVGARWTLVSALAAAAAGSIWIAFVERPWEALGAGAVLGLGGSVVLPAENALLATVVTAEERSAAFAVRHATLNAGFAVGATASAFIVSISSVATFQFVYFLDAGTFLAFAVALFLLPRLGRRVEVAREAAERVGYRAVLTDRTFLRVWLLMVVLVTAGYAQYQAAFPAYATAPGRLGAGQLGIAFAANMFAVVLLQLVALKAMTGRRRTRGILLVCTFFSAAWALTLVAGSRGSGAPALALFVLAMVLLAAGETLMSPAIPPLVNDLAPDHLRGRYNGAFALTWTVGFAAGPAIAGVVLGAGHGTALFLGLIAACAFAAVLTGGLEARLPEEANRVGGTRREPATADGKRARRLLRAASTAPTRDRELT